MNLYRMREKIEAKIKHYKSKTVLPTRTMSLQKKRNGATLPMHDKKLVFGEKTEFVVDYESREVGVDDDHGG